MIDTDKYKGHTKGPWSDETELYWVMEEDDGSFQVEIDHKPDRLLIHDAPLLLAEYKQLREDIEGYRAIWNYLDPKGYAWDEEEFVALIKEHGLWRDEEE